jgi:hypothetical protein
LKATGVLVRWRNVPESLEFVTIADDSGGFDTTVPVLGPSERSRSLPKKVI